MKKEKMRQHEKAFVRALLKMYYCNAWRKPTEYEVYRMMRDDIDRYELEDFINREWETLIVKEETKHGWR